MNDALSRAVAAAQRLKAEGFFLRVEQGDQRAASLFARLVAYTLNPTGDPSSFGWLRKTRGGTNVDGYAEDAICYGSDPNADQNVIDMVNGTGAPGASIGAGDWKPRRIGADVWETPKPLALVDLRYLNPAYDPPTQATPSNQPSAVAVNPNAPLLERLARLESLIVGLSQQMAEQHAPVCEVDLSGVQAQISDVRAALRNGLSVEASGKLPYVGVLKLIGVAKG